jgi:hypothetical protein
MKKIFHISISFWLISNVIQAQQFKMSQGISITEYQFTNDLGQKVKGIRSAPGISTQASFHKEHLVDINNLNIEQSKIGILLGQNPKLLKFLTFLNYDLGIQYLQMNSVGDIQKNAFSYQTDYLGVQGKFGLRVKLPLNFSLNLQGLVSGHKMLYGSQFVNGYYVDLAEDQQFSAIKLLGGFGGEFERKFSDRLVGFFAYQQSQTLNGIAQGQSTLNFKPVVFSLGFRMFN